MFVCIVLEYKQKSHHLQDWGLREKSFLRFVCVGSTKAGQPFWIEMTSIPIVIGQEQPPKVTPLFPSPADSKHLPKGIPLWLPDGILGVARSTVAVIPPESPLLVLSNDGKAKARVG